jgi:methionine synthase I (cobalamin-dependent)
VGSIGPTIVDTVYESAHGLMFGGVDMLLIETITSLETLRTQLEALDRLFELTSRVLPIMLSVTISKQEIYFQENL